MQRKPVTVMESLLHLGCKGPVTRNACSAPGWNQGTSMPMHSGHGCLGCSEPDFRDRWEPRGGVYATLGAGRNRWDGRTENDQHTRQDHWASHPATRGWMRLP